MNKKFIETIKVDNAKIFNLKYHQLRLESVVGSDILDLKSILSPPLDGLYRCRIIYDKNSYSVKYYKYEKRIVNKLKIIRCDNIEYSKKYLDRTKLDDLFAKRGVADDILIIKNDLVTDTSIANIAFLEEGRWITPKQPLLNGTTRMRLLDESRLFEKNIYIDDLKNFQAVALLNAMVDFDIIHNKKIEDIFC